MSTNLDTIRNLAERDYKWGFITDIEDERVPKGLNEEIIRVISAKKHEPEFMLEWRLKGCWPTSVPLALFRARPSGDTPQNLVQAPDWRWRKWNVVHDVVLVIGGQPGHSRQ